MNNRIYIAGRITGDPNFREKFKSAASEVSQAWFGERHTPQRYVRLHNKIMRFKAINPIDFTLLGIPLTEYRWHIGMAVCLWKLLFCSSVYMISDWEGSRGATIEHNTARFLGKCIVYQNGKQRPTKKNLDSARGKYNNFLGRLLKTKHREP